MKMLSLRLPDDLHQDLKELAEKEHRSLHAQIIYILEKYIERWKAEKKTQG
jgi:predicted transcriptional regulator